MKISLLGTLAAVTLALAQPASGHENQTPEHQKSENETPEWWYASGEREVARRREKLDAPQARNLILFIGDGMSVATVSAARILAGQQAGGSGEEYRLSFENFRHTALARTYNTDQQTPDSAGTMTAMATGVKSFGGAIAVDQRAVRGDCESMAGTERPSLIELAAAAGLTTGVVTTTRITHATPAALFAKSPERGWESDTAMPPSAREAGCRDIARQLVEFDLDGPIDVVLGGGRAAFVPTDVEDPEYPARNGQRSDGVNLIERWQQRYPDGYWAWNRQGFDAIEPGFEGPVLGLFEPSHMQYEHDRALDPGGEPSIAEMTIKALELLQARAESGYVLVVEGGRIDHAHHAGNAYRALTDTIAFADAVAAARARVDLDETLIVVTADHGHALHFSGYSQRGRPILGLAHGTGLAGGEPRVARDQDGKPYTTLSYINGPGFRPGPRPDYEDIDPHDPDFRQEALVGLASSTHSGEDVVVYAIGAGAEVLYGSIEQHLIFHALLQAQARISALADAIRNDAGLPDWQRLLARVRAQDSPD